MKSKLYLIVSFILFVSSCSFSFGNLDNPNEPILKYVFAKGNIINIKYDMTSEKVVHNKCDQYDQTTVKYFINTNYQITISSIESEKYHCTLLFKEGECYGEHTIAGDIPIQYRDLIGKSIEFNLSKNGNITDISGTDNLPKVLAGNLNLSSKEYIDHLLTQFFCEYPQNIDNTIKDWEVSRNETIGGMKIEKTEYCKILKSGNNTSAYKIETETKLNETGKTKNVADGMPIDVKNTGTEKSVITCFENSLNPKEKSIKTEKTGSLTISGLDPIPVDEKADIKITYNYK